MHALASSPWMSNLQSLSLYGDGIGVEGARALAESPYLRSLRELYLQGGNALGSAGVVAIAQSPVLASAERLYLMSNDIGPEGAVALARSPYLGNVRQLNLLRNPIVAGVTALAEHATMPRLRTLYLGGTSMNDAGAIALASAPFLTELRELMLMDNSLGDAAAIALANSPGLARLKELDLNMNVIGDAGALALAASPYLTLPTTPQLGMSGLRLHENPIGAAGRQALRARFGKNVGVSESLPHATDFLRSVLERGGRSSHPVPTGPIDRGGGDGNPIGQLVQSCRQFVQGLLIGLSGSLRTLVGSVAAGFQFQQGMRDGPDFISLPMTHGLFRRFTRQDSLAVRRESGQSSGE